MKKILVLAALAAVVSANATVYTDSTGDVIVPGSPFPHLDIASMEITNTLSSITFKFNLVGDPVATDWGKYMVIIDSVSGGDTVSNGWVRPISMASGADSWLGSWVDGGNGFENRAWNGSSWFLAGATYNSTPGMSITKDSSSVSLSLNLSDLGLSVGNTFQFDAFSSGGGSGDGAVDSLGNPNPQITNWGDHSEARNQRYTVVPEPASMTALALGGLALIRRRRNK
ncbi:MAG: PEP-CTERM sorting domain-containing protein [Fimbriimonadaceae bacterium]|nr:PEP-CTERM sorting domain-containing protein [Fimbriimonadaceae bacterium]